MLTLILSISGTVLMIAYILWLYQNERKKNRYSPFTEKMLRSPGYTLSNELDDVVDKMMAPFFMIGFCPLLYFILTKDFTLGYKVITGVPILALMIWEMLSIRKLFLRSRKLKLGLDGEVYSGQELNYLMRQGAWVYHDIPYKYGNIDHVIVSKAGVFTVETKTISKPINDHCCPVNFHMSPI